MSNIDNQFVYVTEPDTILSVVHIYVGSGQVHVPVFSFASTQFQSYVAPVLDDVSEMDFMIASEFPALLSYYFMRGVAAAADVPAVQKVEQVLPKAVVPYVKTISEFSPRDAMLYRALTTRLEKIDMLFEKVALLTSLFSAFDEVMTRIIAETKDPKYKEIHDISESPELQTFVSDMYAAIIPLLDKASQVFGISSEILEKVLRTIGLSLASKDPSIIKDPTVKLHGFLLYAGQPPDLFVVVDERNIGRALVKYEEDSINSTTNLMNDISTKKHWFNRISKRHRREKSRRKH